MYFNGRGPIYEPKESRYRPNSVSTLISFLFGRLVGRAFKAIVNRFRNQR